MKKFYALTLGVLSVLGAQAKDIPVITNGQVDAGFVCYNWWNPTVSFGADNPAGEGKVFTITHAAEGPNFSAGIHTNGQLTGPLHSATLNFDWYCATAGCKYTIRLKGKTDVNYEFAVTDENAGKWNKLALSVAEVYPVTAKEWNEFAEDGTGVVFSVVSEGNPEGNTLSVNNVYYSNIDEAWTKPEVGEKPAPEAVPAPEVDAKSVLSLFSAAYSPVVEFNMGNWGQNTRPEVVEIGGRKAYKMNSFNYLGWELASHIDVSGCDRVHVDVFPSTGGYMGFTPISPGKELTKGCDLTAAAWNALDVELSYFEGVDLKDVFQFKFDGGNGDPYYLGNVYFYNSQGADVSVGNIAADSAAAEYYNLQGMRVSNPVSGQMYIVRQGNTVSKVIK